MRVALVLGALVLVAAALGSACGDDDDGSNGGGSPTASPANGVSSGLPQGSEPYDLDPANFVAQIDNPYWPMTPGSRWVYTETDADGTELQVEVTVTDETKEIMGITATVVHDVVSEDGEVVEDTFDWYAQDADGNIWYLGEDTKEYEDGEVISTAGSWEAGVDGALAGVLIPGSPVVGMSYRQEHYEGEAEDRGKVLSLDEAVEVPYGSFEGCLQTEDTTPLEPDVLENKYYCEGVGPVLAADLSGGGREELITFEEGG
jgi:hypothetical protein